MKVENEHATIVDKLQTPSVPKFILNILEKLERLAVNTVDKDEIPALLLNS